MFNNSKIKITEYNFISKKLLQPITIAHLSDLHEKVFGISNINLFNEVREVMPNFICITGDMVRHEKQKYYNANYMEEFAKGISAIAPTFFVTGNHEKRFSPKTEDIFAKKGVVVLKNQLIALNIKGNNINVSGNDDTAFDDVKIEHSVDNFINAEGYNVFLTHRPEHITLLKNSNVDLILCGHTHAGQIRIMPFTHIYMSGQGFFPKYMQGAHSAQETDMVISRGLGASGYPTFRVNNPPELVKITVHPQK